MESLYSLPLLADLLKNEKYEEALEIIERGVEVLAPYVNIPDTLQMEGEYGLTLVKVYLIQKRYDRCVSQALISQEYLGNLDEFYHGSVIYRMMEHLLENKDDRELRKFVLNFIVGTKSDSESDSESFLGYLSEIREYGILREKIKGLSQTQVNCKALLNEILNDSFEEVQSVFLECPLVNESMLEYIIGAYFYNDRMDDLKVMLESLEWKMQYRACFYIEDVYGGVYDIKGNRNDNKNTTNTNTPINIKNDNANFILSGDFKTEIMSNFMFKNSKASFKFLETMSKARAPYISLCNCIMNAGTTNDTLYRNNKSLMTGREWTRFLEYSCLGMIHQGNINPFEILKEVLPSLESANGEPAALMSLGSMNAGKNDKETTEFLLNWIENPSDEIVFGSCMGIGLNCLGTSDSLLFEKLKGLFAIDSTIAQESAVYAIGLVYAGSGNFEIIEFLNSICDKTDFQRVKRCCGLSIGMIHCLSSSYESNRMDDRMNDKMDDKIDDKIDDESMNNIDIIDNIMDIHDITSIGCSYVGSADLNLIKNILPFINDGDDDVKRAAVISLSLIAYDDNSIRDSCIAPLAQNHNPIVRAAVALVLGLFSSGQGDIAIINLLEALLYDSDVLVRQNACIGIGLSLIQMNPEICINYKRILDRINLMIISKGEGSCVKIGASIGRAFAETGGKSAIFSLKNISGAIEIKRVAGALLFLNSWYWYPLMGCISLCILPTPIFFFNQNLDETDHSIKNDQKYFDYLVKIPEIKKSRKFKQCKHTETVKNIRTDAKDCLKSGDRLTYHERVSMGMDFPIIFKD